MSLESKAAPKHEALVYALNLHSLKLDRIIEQNDEIIGQNIEVISLNKELNETEKGRSEFDVVTHEQWAEAKAETVIARKKESKATWMQVVIGVVALTFTMAGFYFGVMDLNRDNPAVIMVHDAVKAIRSL